jgi:predicted acylesterase/phospholipase RssA
MEINEVHSHKAKLGLADLLINPPVGTFSLLEFESWERIIEVGYRAGQDAMREWSKSQEPAAEQPEGSLIRT